MSEERFGLHVPPQERRPVAWYAPAGLRRVAREQLWSMNLLRNLDRRETWSGPIEVTPLAGLADAQGDFWFDFLADTGDGGNATTAVAQGALAAQLTATGLDGQPLSLPEGQLLVLGGDLAYPGASPETYQSRLVEMFELARDARSRFTDAPALLAHDALFTRAHKLVAAIPQNHDWFDSASTFCRYFVHPEKAGLVGARAPQPRTYFALQLPHRWLVLGLDFALTGDLDRAQFEAFAALAEPGRLPEGTQLVLVYPEPYWTRTLGDGSHAAYPKRYQRLEHLFHRAGLPIRARIAGDLHHYAREQLTAGPDGCSTELITCGSGGAFGHATHVREVSEPKFMQIGEDERAVQDELRGRVFIGRGPHGRAPGLADDVNERLLRYEPRATYPAPDVSWRRSWRNLVALLRLGEAGMLQSNFSFAAGTGALYLLACALPGALMGLALLPVWFGAAMMATDNDPARASRADHASAWALCAAQVPLVLGLQWLFTHGPLARWWPAWPARAADWLDLPALGATVLQGFAAGFIALGLCTLTAGLVFGTFLALRSALGGALVNNASSALADEDHKGFLRFRVHAGGLEVFMLGIDQVPRRWRAAPEATARPYWQPAEGEPALAWRVVDHFHISR